MTPLSVSELLQQLPPNARVFVSGSAGEPVALTTALAAAPELAPGARFYCSFIPGVNSSNLAVPGQRQMGVYFMQPGFASALADGSVDFSPMSYNHILQTLSQPGYIDTLLLQVSPPDASGRCSLGPQGEFLPGLLATKSRILAVINPNVPALPHSPSVAMAEISAYTEDDAPLRSYDAGKSNSLSQAIAEHIATLIPDGATLQCGLGKVPAQLMAALANHRGLRLHSGMVSDGLLSLLDNKVLEPGSDIVSTVALGSADFYQRLADIPQLRICGVEQSHHPAVLASLSHLRAVNSALEIDLMGQVNAEVLGGKAVSGPGGLPDFAAAARAREDGLSIIALPAADPSGKHSRLVAQLAAGTPVAVPQYNVDAVVTEYGVALLRGLDQRRRARALIDIAHPEHREALAKQWRDSGRGV